MALSLEVLHRLLGVTRIHAIGMSLHSGPQ
jgi:hypothetical protein